MDELSSVVASIATALHPDRIETIALAIGQIASPSEFDRCRSSFGPGTDVKLVSDLKQAWLAYPIVTGVEIAFGLRAASRALNSDERVDLVWTGPKTGLIPTRNTEQAILEVIDEADQHLFIVSYVFHNAASIVSGLSMAAKRGVSIRILLESSTEHGGAVTGDGFSAMHRAVPEAALFLWNPQDRSRTAGSLSAAVHAKCAVADQRIAFITSANLTSAAMERNMELGVLLRGGNAPARLHDHLNALISTGTIVGW